jgi:hypothetical protein
MDIVIEYDSEILIVNDVTKGSLTTDSVIDYTLENGEIKVIINDIEGFSGEGTILSMFFEVSGQAGDNCTINILELEANDASSYVDKLLQVVPGQFIVVENVQGTITCLTSLTDVNIDETLVLSGSISPKSKHEVILSLMDPNGGLHEVITITDEAGSYSIDYSPMVEGDWEVVASWEYESENIQSSSIGFSVREQTSQNGGIPSFPLMSIIAALTLYYLLSRKPS